ncbi:glutamate--cysteine ligase [Propionicimonas sp.]|uniref:glutamate--cysteine ligase n=1 Tax=Propionicimonas sp. TaxID=1955623 RepID=UPI0039E5399B
MGRDLESATFTREQRQRYREKVKTCLDVFEQMLASSSFEFDRPLVGMEIELNLVDPGYRPRLANAEVLAAIADPEYQTELARFNIEFNVAPHPLGGDSAVQLESDLRASLNEAERRCAEVGAHIIMIGILPTITPQTYEGEWMSANARYQALNDAVLAARGEDIHLDITGPSGERLLRYADSLAPESACTSMQLHLQVRPSEFAAHWNAAQVLAGPQLALGANSPYFMGKELWAETRIELFTQAADTRPEELKNQGVRPRVFFGERWITSIFDLFEENTRYFPAMLPELDDEDPQEAFDAGRTPRLEEMRLHNGTIYRWNRPIYDLVDGRPHLRVENRVLPAGPTIVDTLANAALYYGALHTMAQDDRPLWSRMSFGTARENFLAGARHGIDATLFWPGRGEIPASELVLRELLPMAHQGLDAWGVAPAVRNRLLGVIEGRCLSGQNGADWQVATVRRWEARGLSRPDALREMLAAYAAHMHANEPVHTWELPA